MKLLVTVVKFILIFKISFGTIIPLRRKATSTDNLVRPYARYNNYVAKRQLLLVALVIRHFVHRYIQQDGQSNF